MTEMDPVEGKTKGDKMELDPEGKTKGNQKERSLEIMMGLDPVEVKTNGDTKRKASNRNHDGTGPSRGEDKWRHKETSLEITMEMDPVEGKTSLEIMMVLTDQERQRARSKRRRWRGQAKGAQPDRVKDSSCPS